MFASRSISEHLLRGVLGIGAVLVVMSSPAIEMPAWLDLTGRVLLGIAALLLLRGCPMCWLQGLVETIIARRRIRACVDGSCRP